MGWGLAGLQVLELGGGVTAATTGKMLADLGATVVKIEPPVGDPERFEGPFRNGDRNPEPGGRFLYLNTNKRSVALDLRSEEDRGRFEELEGYRFPSNRILRGFF